MTMKRRDLLKTIAATGAATLLDRPGFGFAPPPAKRLKKAEIMMDQYTWYRLPWLRRVFSDPLRGHYDSDDVATVERQNEEKNFFAVPVDCVSWWGPTHWSYELFQQGYLRASNFSSRRFCFLYEITGRLRQSRVLNAPAETAAEEFARGRLDGEWKRKYHFDFRDAYNRDTFLADIDFLAKHHFASDNYYRIDGRPVLYIWTDNLKFFDATSARARKTVYLIGSEPFFYPPEPSETERFTRPNWYDAITSYGMNPVYVAKNWRSLRAEFRAAYVRMARTWVGLLKTHAPDSRLLLPVQFTYHDKNGSTDPKDGRNRILTCQKGEGEAFLQEVKTLFEKTPRILGLHLTSYNEHYEGTSFEPSVFEAAGGLKIGYGSRWLTLVKRAFKDNVLA
ncbi:MAG: DUF5010 domain-containing protein [Candidatus Aminicenantes bacterium]|nr:DUF5010 domain-containing protein [Candidatus Aminicenantes bacterium]